MKIITKHRRNDIDTDGAQRRHSDRNLSNWQTIRRKFSMEWDGIAATPTAALPDYIMRLPK